MSGSTNYLQINPSYQNADNDTTYASESLTLNGVAPGGIIGHGFLNKFWIRDVHRSGGADAVSRQQGF